MRAGYPEGCVVSHDSTDQGFSRHMPVTKVPVNPPHRYSLDLDEPCPPESDHGHARIHSENGTGTTACSFDPEGPLSHTINRMMTTNNAQSAYTVDHISIPSHRLRVGLPCLGHDRPKAAISHSAQIRSDPITGRVRSVSGPITPKGHRSTVTNCDRQ
jgi:hypothetical protein